MGAGVLPIARHNNKLYFLFGKEYGPNAKNKWSDFGGKCEKNESIFTTAVREGTEETNGFLGSENELRKLVSTNKITTISTNTKEYTTYLFEIDYDEKLPHYYNNNFKFIEKNRSNIVKSNNGLYEKSEIKWFTIDEIKHNKHQFRNFYKEIIYKILIHFND